LTGSPDNLIIENYSGKAVIGYVGLEGHKAKAPG
jgi:hypothetical protein